MAQFLIATLIVAYSVPARVLAQEVTPDPTPTSAQTEVTNDTTASSTTDTNANTGDNSIGPTPTPEVTEEQATPTPSPEPSPSPEPTPKDVSLTSESPPATESGVTATNSATLTNDVSSTADSGNNAISQPSPTPESESQETEGSGPSSEEATPSAAITTGDAVAITTVDNAINTTELNSQVFYQIINIFVDQAGDINLTDPAGLVAQLLTEYPDESVINVALTQITNTANVSNTITSTANTGGNSINGATTDAAITTGNAYSLVSALNRINLVMVDSVLHIVTINIFGSLNGNIVLPENIVQPQSEPCPDCGSSTNIDNTATVNNTLDSQAISGQNSITDAANGEITTGTATSVIQLTNIANTNLVGVNLIQLAILPFGAWNGQFRGWGQFGAQNGGAPLSLSQLSAANGSGCPTCAGNVALINATEVNNNISSGANSGGNSLNGNGTIQTGRAVSLISLINLVNTNLIRSSGFFGFINIFGSWTGDIGGANFFATSEETPSETLTEPTPTPAPNSDSSAPNKREDGGKLAITQSHNVGEYVLPGDTVTFFITAKNTGAGRVFDASVNLKLIKDGVDMGGVNFAVGTIEPGRGVKITTGLVLSKQTPGGSYLARATVKGTVGENNTGISASADTNFLVFGTTGVLGNLNTEPPTEAGTTAPAVLAATYPTPEQQANVLRALLVLLLLAPGYIVLRVTQKREILGFLFTHNLSWRSRLRGLQLFLL